MPDMFTNGAMPAVEQLIGFTEARQRVITDNIANVDTPGYKVRDLPVGEFRAELERAVGQKRKGELRYLPFSETEHIGVSRDGLARPRAVELAPEQAGVLRHDGNNVSIDHEIVKLTTNTMLHNMMVQLLAREFSMLNTAVTERVG